MSCEMRNFIVSTRQNALHMRTLASCWDGTNAREEHNFLAYYFSLQGVQCGCTFVDVGWVDFDLGVPLKVCLAARPLLPHSH